MLSTTTYPRAKAVLQRWKTYVVNQAKSNLTRGKHKASGELHKSIKGFVNSKMNRDIKGKFTGGSTMPSITFEMLQYGKFLDEGVKGSKSSYPKSMLSPNKFRNGKKSVPVGPIRKWLNAKGLDQKLAFIISKSIYEKGIEKTGFFERAFDKRRKITFRAYHHAIADDIANNFANKITKKLASGINVKQILK